MLKTIAVGMLTSVAMGLASAGAYAMPVAAGEMPFGVAPATTQAEDTVFAPLANRTMPAAGERDGVAHVSPAQLSRAQVEGRTLQAAHDAHGFPGAYGEQALSL